MEEQAARKIGEYLENVGKTNAEKAWVMWAAPRAFPSSVQNLWLPREGDTAHWLHGQALVSAIAEEESSVRINARPSVHGDWRIEVVFSADQLEDAGFVTPGLKSHWKFLLPGGVTFEVEGETLVEKDSSNPREAEQLASKIATNMLESAA